MTINMAQFHQVFFDESFEGLDSMERGLLQLTPGAADPEEINAIFRAAHSIKGGSGTFGFGEVADFTHGLESILDEMRAGRRALTAAAVDVFLQSVDVLRDMLVAARDGGRADADKVQAGRAALDRMLDGTGQAPASPPGSVPAADSGAGPVGWRIAFRPHSDMLQTGNDPLRILRELASLGDASLQVDLQGLPALADMDPEALYLAWDVTLSAAIDRACIEEVFEWVEGDCDVSVVPIPRSEPDPATEPGLKVAPAPEERRSDGDRRLLVERRKSQGGNSIRVDVDKVDALINLVGELVITQSMLGTLGADFDMRRVGRLHEGLVQLERHTRELQAGVMRIRMLPISSTFSRFPRLVHDLSSELGKRVELVMQGETTEVDKTVIEKIGDPLVHLVRNSLDHGIEPPDERVRAGKPEVGTITLSAAHKGGSVVVEVRDDGRGLDRKRIWARAIERGLVHEQDELSDKAVYDLVFQPGFSTADRVSGVSGRGVGMDVVRRNINEVGGGIEIESEAGRGSAIIVRLPLTLAILDAQSVAVGGETYVIPLVSIVESVRVREDGVSRVAGHGEAFRLRGEYLPIVRLQAVFGVPGAAVEALHDGILVVVEGEGRRCGLFVDALLGQQQVVVKSLESNYRRVEGISGATIMGDGSVALIVDVPGLMRLARRDARPAPGGLALSA